jgi:hypothetical protein
MASIHNAKNQKLTFNKHPSNLIASFLFFTIAGYVYFKSIVGSLVFNLVDGSTDDTLISHAISWATPELFKNDFRAANFAIETPTSMMNLIPALALRYLGIDPLNFYLIFLLIQVYLLPFAVFKLAKTFKVSNQNSILLTLIFLTIRPQYWNFAWIGDLDWMPYATWMALPFLLLYVSYKLQSNAKKAYTFLSIGIAFHPTFGTLILLFDLIWECQSAKYKITSKEFLFKNRLRNLTYVISGLYLMCNLIYIRSKSARPIPNGYTEAIIGNNHFKAVITSPHAVTWRTTYTAAILFVTIIAIILSHEKLDSLKVQYQSILPSLIFTLVSTSILQIIAIKIENLNLLRVMFTRFSIFFSAVIFIFAISTLLQQKLKPIQIVTYIIFILFPGELSLYLILISLFIFRLRVTSKFATQYLLGIYLISCFMLTQVTRIRSRLFSVFSWSSVEGDVITLLRSKSPYGNLLTDRFTSQLLILILILLSTYVFLISSPLIKKGSKRSSLQFSVIAVCLFLGLISGRQLETSIRHDSKTASLFEVQNWAKNETESGTVFMGYDWSTYLGWRTFSRRGMMYVTDCGSSPYFYSKSDAVCQKLQDLVLRTTNSEIDQIKTTSNLIGADYILKRTDQKLPLKIAFSNKDYIVYDLRNS